MNEEIREFIDLALQIVYLSDDYKLYTDIQLDCAIVDLDVWNSGYRHWEMFANIDQTETWKQTLTNLLKELKNI